MNNNTNMSNTDHRVTDNMVVSIDYSLRLDDDELVDASDAGEPLSYIHGQQMIVPGLERALEGMAVGEEADVVVQPDEGYGEYDPEDTEWLPLDAFPADMQMEAGMPVELVDDEANEVFEAYISEVGDDEIKVDFNHPLAGETLHFHVKVVDVRPATAEELDHGHVHDMGDHLH